MLASRRGLVLGISNERSLGWAVACAWRRAGAEVVVGVQDLARFGPRVASMAADEPALWAGSPPHVVSCDVDSDAEVAACAAAVGARLEGRLDMLMHAIAFAPKECLHARDPAPSVGGTFTHTPRSGFLRAMETSAYSLVAVGREFGPMLAAGAASRSGTSALLTLTFDGSRRVVPGYNVMGPCKAALETSVRYLASELGAHGVRVNALSSGPINTLAARGLPRFAELRRHAEAAAPLRVPLHAGAVGDVAAFLASDLAAHVTGQTLLVDSGYSVV
jgi:enoyl-[acyl-carrier protein] reductase I